MTEILETKTQPIISLNGAYYILISKKARFYHGRPGKPIDHKLHNAVVETVMENDGCYSRIHFEAKPAPAEAQPVQAEPRSAVEAIEQAQAAEKSPGIPVESQVAPAAKKEGQ